MAAVRTDDATALALAALTLSALDGRHGVSVVMLERALEQTPSSAIAHIVSALVSMMLGRPRESAAHAEQALRLSPFDPMRHVPEGARAVARLAAGDEQAALAGARRCVEANPAFAPGLITLTLCLVRCGHVEEARAAMRRVLDIAPDTGAATLQERFLFANGLGIDSIIADLRVAGLPD